MTQMATATARERENAEVTYMGRYSPASRFTTAVPAYIWVSATTDWLEGTAD